MLVERLVSTRLQQYADIYKLYSSAVGLHMASLNWHGCRPTYGITQLTRRPAYIWHHSTDTAVAIVHNDIDRATNDGDVSVLLLLDLTAAFDTVDHSVLNDVMQHRFGVRDTALNWFQSYITNRNQSFHISSDSVGPVQLSCSVPQRSVLGSLRLLHTLKT